mgnify:CR=1 FL=1
MSGLKNYTVTRTIGVNLEFNPVVGDRDVIIGAL